MKHNTTVYIRQNDGAVVGPDEAFSKDGILKSGFAMRTSLQMMDSEQKTGFHIDDQGRVFKDGAPFKVPLELCDDGVARPTLDRRKHKVTTEYGPDGRVTNRFEAESDEDETDDAAPALLADGTTVASHRPHFGTVDRATLEKLDAIRTTHDYLDS